MPFVEMLQECELRRILNEVSIQHSWWHRDCSHTEDHAIDSKLLAMSSVVLQKEHVSCSAQDEEE
jgi:hypothetical protein